MPIRFSLPPEPGYGAILKRPDSKVGVVYFRQVSPATAEGFGGYAVEFNEPPGPTRLAMLTWWDVLKRGPVELVRSGRTEWPLAIDPSGCGCTECLTGEYVPLDSATNEQIRLMLAGEIACNLPGDTRLVTRVTVCGGNPAMPITVVTHTETVGGEQ